MRISLDYDGTITADPILWKEFAVRATERGHEVKVVTSRNEDSNKNGVTYRDNQSVLEWAAEAGVEVIFCGFKQKQDVWRADIWIDDNPHMVASYESFQWMLDNGYLRQPMS